MAKAKTKIEKLPGTLPRRQATIDETPAEPRKGGGDESPLPEQDLPDGFIQQNNPNQNQTF